LEKIKKTKGRKLMTVILAIASGGAMGAVLRHLIGQASLKLLGSSFPYGTLSVNVLGSLIMGLLIAYFAHHWNPSHEVRAFLTVGLLGAFTTFSTFSLDVATLWERGDQTGAFLYILISVVLSITALFAGLFIIRQIYS
jgi:CrcB protein